MIIDIVVIGTAFLLIWISAILFVFLRSNSPNKELAKFIGSFSVILLSLYANTKEVYIAGVIIAGLVIASERFMFSLVSILRGDKSFLTSKNFIQGIGKMSGDEIEAKKQKEVEEIKEAVTVKKIKIKKKRKTPTRGPKIKKTEYMKKLPEMEIMAINKFVSGTNLSARKNVKFGDVHIDAIAESKKGKVYIIEAKVFPNMQDYTEKSISHIIEQRMKIFVPQMLLLLNNSFRSGINYRSRSFVFMVLLIIDSDINLDYVKERISMLKQLYNKPNQRVLVKFVFYNMPKLVLQSTNRK